MRKLEQVQLAYSVGEAAEAAKICRTIIYRMINEKKLKARKIGRRTIILHTDLEEFLNNLETYEVQNEGVRNDENSL